MLTFRSQNFDNRCNNTTIQHLVLHYTGMKSGEAALNRLCDPSSKVSAHYLILESGGIISLVEEEKRAWHAGKSAWRGQKSLNNTSIGIEIVNKGHEHGYHAFPLMQMEQLAILCQTLIQEHIIPTHNVVGHSDIAPDRKEDPGEKFNWKLLADKGIGFWPSSPHNTNTSTQDISNIQKNLKKYGYSIEETGVLDKTTTFVIVAFKRRFIQHELTPIWTIEAEDKLNQLLNHLDSIVD